MIGVPSSLFSGRGPKLSVLNRHAGSSLLKLLALIWSSGEYLLPLRSAVYIGHSPFFVLGCPVFWPWMRGTKVAPRMRRATAGTSRTVVRLIGDSIFESGNGSEDPGIIGSTAKCTNAGMRMHGCADARMHERAKAKGRKAGRHEGRKAQRRDCRGSFFGFRL